MGRICHRQPAPRRARVGEDVQPPVPARVQPGPGVHALLDRLQLRPGRPGGGQVGQPHVVARGGALRGRDHQPAAVPADRDAVVVRLVPALAEDQHVLVGGRADRVQVHPAVKLLLTGRDLARRELADVIERLAARQPGHRGVAAAADRAVHRLAGYHIQHPQFRLLVPAGGQLVGEQPALLVRLPGIERGQPGRVQGRRVNEHPLRLPRGGRHQRPVFLPGQAAREELPRPAPDRGADVPGAHQLLEPGREPGPPGQPGLRAGPQRVLGPQPFLGFRARRVLQPAVRVGHAVAVQILDETGAAGRRIPRRRRRCGGRGGVGGSHDRTLSEHAARRVRRGGRGQFAVPPRRRYVCAGIASYAVIGSHTVLPRNPVLGGNQGACPDSRELARHTSACPPHQAGGGLATGTAAQRDV